MERIPESFRISTAVLHAAAGLQPDTCMQCTAARDCTQEEGARWLHHRHPRGHAVEQGRSTRARTAICTSSVARATTSLYIRVDPRLVAVEGHQASVSVTDKLDNVLRPLQEPETRERGTLRRVILTGRPGRHPSSSIDGDQRRAPRRAHLARLRGCPTCACRRWPASERQLRVRPGRVPDERHAGDKPVRHPQLGIHGLRGVHPVRDDPGRHGPVGSPGRARGAAGRGLLRPAAARRDQRRLLLRHLQRGAHLRPGREAQRLRRPLQQPRRRGGRAPHPDGLQHQRLGLLLLGLHRRANAGRGRHPRHPPRRRRRRRPGLRAHHRRRRHQDPHRPQSSFPRRQWRRQQHAEERGVRGRSLRDPGQRGVRGAGAAHGRGRRVASPGVDGDVLLQGGEVHRRGPLRGAVRVPRRGAGGRGGDGAGAGGGDGAWGGLQDGVLRRGCRGRVRRGLRRARQRHRHARDGGRGGREHQRGALLEGRRQRRIRVGARGAGVQGRGEAHPRGAL